MDSACITRLLERSRSGDARAFDELMPFVYGQLKAMAAQYLATVKGYLEKPAGLLV